MQHMKNNKRPPQIQQLNAQLQVIKHVWKDYGRRLKSWWSQQNKEERLKFLLEWCPYMPLARDKPYLFVDGKKEDVSGVSTIAPEWNQQDLVQGSCLIELLQQVAEVPGDGEPGAAPGYDAFTELCLRGVPAAASLVGRIKSSLSREVQKSGIAMLTPGDLFGTEYVVKKMVPSLQQMLDRGAAVPSTVFEALMIRLNVVLGQAAMCLDHFRVEVMKRDTYKAVGPQMGCANCGAVELKDGSGGRLLACGACGCIFYCGKDCQKAHWREHKPSCKPKPKEKPAAAPQAAAAQGQAGGGVAAGGTAESSAGNTASDAAAGSGLT